MRARTRLGPIRVDISALELSFGLAPYVAERLDIQLARADSLHARQRFVERLQMALTRALGELVDADLMEPTRDQIEHALVLARDTLIAIPGEALRYRGTMDSFLARHTYRKE